MAKIYSAKQAAEYIGVSRTAVYDWMNEGPPKGLRYMEIGDRYKIIRQEWIDESERAQARMRARDGEEE